MTRRITFFLFALLCISIGLYPLAYLLGDMSGGLLNTKSETLLASTIWKTGFYAHIVFGGIALLTGWSQFSTTMRKNKMHWHRILGKIYVISVLVGGLAGFYLGFNATGGWIARSGFISLAIIWLYTTGAAYAHIRKGEVQQHQMMMIYSYAACFAAVTLRLWLPLLTTITSDFIPAYRMVAWLCWVPNLVVAYYLHQKSVSVSDKMSPKTM